MPGYSLADCWEVVGDTLDYTVSWANGPDVSSLAGKPVRLHIEVTDADVYSLQFCAVQ